MAPGRQGRNLNTASVLFTTYILFSDSLARYYIGYTNNFTRRFKEHNSGQSKSTKSGIPWRLVWAKTYYTKSEASKKEIIIKKRGARRFLSDQIINSPFQI